MVVGSVYQAQNLAFPSGLGKSGEEGEHVGCVLQVGEEMSICARL